MSATYTITVNIADAFHPTNPTPANPAGGKSAAGHMWITLPDGSSAGYGPEGFITSDNNTYAPGYNKIEIKLTQAQMDKLNEFLKDPGKHGFTPGNGVINRKTKGVRDINFSAKLN